MYMLVQALHLSTDFRMLCNMHINSVGESYFVFKYLNVLLFLAKSTIFSWLKFPFNLNEDEQINNTSKVTPTGT